jgi:hypothetical protein
VIQYDRYFVSSLKNVDIWLVTYLTKRLIREQRKSSSSNKGCIEKVVTISILGFTKDLASLDPIFLITLMDISNRKKLIDLNMRDISNTIYIPRRSVIMFLLNILLKELLSIFLVNCFQNIIRKISDLFLRCFISQIVMHPSSCQNVSDETIPSINVIDEVFCAINNTRVMS